MKQHLKKLKLFNLLFNNKHNKKWPRSTKEEQKYPFIRIVLDRK